MKYLPIAALMVLLLAPSGMAQFRKSDTFTPSIKEGLVNENSRLYFGFFNPDNLTMHHSYSLSYNAFGGGGLALGVYTNSLMYRFSDNLNLAVDASVVHSPFSSFGKDVTNQLNGVYVSRAELNYKPSEDFMFSIQYRNLPNYYFSPFGYGSYGAAYSANPFLPVK